MTFVLGSASPRRVELLAQIGVIPDDVRPADIDETPLSRELARVYCVRMAREKAEALVLDKDDVSLTADTVVTIGRRTLGKPSDEAEARGFLKLLSGSRHKVITAVAVRTEARMFERNVTTTLKMAPLSDTDIDAYIATGEWQGKAGGYGIQGYASRFIPWIQGSYSAVVGLPLTETVGLLKAAGVIR